MSRPRSTQPTDGELEILNVLWDIGPAELGAIHKALRQNRPVAATTVATMLKVMREKRLIDRADGPRSYLWAARVSRKAARTGLLRRLLDSAFDGSAQRLVAHMLEEEKLSKQDRDAIRQMLSVAGRKTKAKKDGDPR